MTARLAILLFALLFPLQVFAGVFIGTPKDRDILFDELVLLKGETKDIVALKVNDRPIKIDNNGEFTCGLSLRNGKNLVVVRSMDKYNKVNEQNIRLVRLKTFEDMEKLYDGLKHWARNQILYLATYNYIDPYPDNDFHPATAISRGELATWIAKTKKLKIEKVLDKDVFFDVPKENWRAPYIKAVVEAGYLHGYSEQVFGMDDPVSRRDAASIAVRCEGLQMAEKIRPFFQDVPREEKGAKVIYAAKKEGIVKGVSDEMPIYDPDRALTRAEAAILLSRFANPTESIQYLFNFEKGYGKYNFAQIDLPPKIESFMVSPDVFNIKQKTKISVIAKLEPRLGFYPIEKVKVDLSMLGGLADAPLESNDGLEYKLETEVEPLESGYKLVSLRVIDRLGWEAKSDLTVIVTE